MHTAICTFHDRAIAERARDRLLQAGFARHDVHLQHRGHHDSDAMGEDPRAWERTEDPRAWEGTDREIAVSRDMVDRVAGFFVHMFGQEHPEGHHRRYADAVDQGHFVLVVDTVSEAEAQRARDLLHEHSAADLNVVHRPEQKPLREWAQAAAIHESPADPAKVHMRTAEDQRAAGARSDGWSDRADRSEADRERALAAGNLGEQRPLDLRDPDRRDDLDKVGLRYADKDKPGR